MVVAVEGYCRHGKHSFPGEQLFGGSLLGNGDLPKHRVHGIRVDAARRNFYMLNRRGDLVFSLLGFLRLAVLVKIHR